MCAVVQGPPCPLGAPRCSAARIRRPRPGRDRREASHRVANAPQGTPPSSQSAGSTGAAAARVNLLYAGSRPWFHVLLAFGSLPVRGSDFDRRRGPGRWKSGPSSLCARLTNQPTHPRVPLFPLHIDPGTQIPKIARRGFLMHPRNSQPHLRGSALFFGGRHCSRRPFDMTQTELSEVTPQGCGPECVCARGSSTTSAHNTISMLEPLLHTPGCMTASRAHGHQTLKVLQLFCLM